MADTFQLTVQTPTAQVFDGVVATIEASGAVGDFGVLPGHYAYITSIRPGGLVFEDGGTTRVYAVGHGFAQVSAERVSIILSSCEDASSVDVAAARSKLTAAEKVLLDGDPDSTEWADAKIDQEMALGHLLAHDKLADH